MYKIGVIADEMHQYAADQSKFVPLTETQLCWIAYTMTSTERENVLQQILLNWQTDVTEIVIAARGALSEAVVCVPAGLPREVVLR